MTVSSTHLACLNGIAADIQALSLTGITGGNPLPVSQVIVRKLPTDRALTLPCVLVTLVPMPETEEPGTNTGDDYGYPCLATIVTANDQNLTVQDAELNWRQLIRRTFNHTKPPGLVAALNAVFPLPVALKQVKWEPAPVLDLPLFRESNLLVSAAVVRVVTREQRVLIILQDNFPGNAGSELGLHTPAVGGIWTAYAGDIQLDGSGNAVQQSETGGACLYGSETGFNNATIQSTVQFPSGGRAGHAFRITDAQNYWYSILSNAGAGFKIVEVVGGVGTIRASNILNLFSPSTSYTLVTQCYGPTVTASVPGVASIQYTLAASGLNATKHGLYGDGATTTGQEWANLFATNP